MPLSACGCELLCHRLNRITSGHDLRSAVQPFGAKQRATEAVGDSLLTAHHVSWVAFGQDGKTMLTRNHSSLRCWQVSPVATGRKLEWPQGSHFHSQAFSRDGTTIAMIVSGADRTEVRLWDCTTAKSVGEPIVLGDGKRVATGSYDRTARFWDAQTCLPLGEVLNHALPVDFISFSLDGSKLLTNVDTTAQLWEVATGRPFAESIRHQTMHSFHPLQFSPDGKCILTMAYHITAILPRLWDTGTGKPRCPCLRATGLKDMAFSPDGTIIVTTSGAIELWDAATGQPLGKPLWTVVALPGSPRIEGVAFSLDSRTLLARANHVGPVFGKARLFEMPQPLAGDPGRLRLWVEVITGRKLDGGGDVAELDAKSWHERHNQLQKLGGAP
jgi:hypothetical protein